MKDGNGESPRGLPAQLREALRAARSGRIVSLEVLRSAVCLYIDELVASGFAGDQVRSHVVSAFQEVGAGGAHDLASEWSTDLVDELIQWCNERDLRPPTLGLES